MTVRGAESVHQLERQFGGQRLPDFGLDSLAVLLENHLKEISPFAQLGNSQSGQLDRSRTDEIERVFGIGTAAVSHPGKVSEKRGRYRFPLGWRFPGHFFPAGFP
jgi:hypothetical protein